MQQYAGRVLQVGVQCGHHPVHTTLAYTIIVRNITFSADEQLIDKARDVARSKRTTLNEEFRSWLASYTGQGGRKRDLDSLYKRLSYVKAGRKFSREEMNER